MWKSIKSAPTVGVFDVWASDGQRYVDCGWASMNWGPQINPHCGLGRFPAGVRPTHWMPRPKSPRMSEEERARYLEGVQWEIDQGHAHQVKCIDGVINRRLDIKTMKQSIEIDWRAIPAWVGDLFRAMASDVRKFWNRHVLRRKNPYWH